MKQLSKHDAKRMAKQRDEKLAKQRDEKPRFMSPAVAISERITLA
ncbi:hypothetical protein [Bradyrhizobium elkanii]|nr:hypothetical protein [Bradyrhizobium elkanii]MCS4108810.1 hypothetical protein [Bradyrhizobium elkanii]